MARRYGRRRADGLYEYSESIDELEDGAAREEREALRVPFALVGLLFGGVLAYGLIDRYVADWPKIFRFIAVVCGAWLGALTFARLAPLLMQTIAIAIAVSVLGAIGYVVWKLL